MNYILFKQLAADYCCSPEDVADGHNHYSVHQFLEGRRRYLEKAECYLKTAVVNGKVLFTGSSDIIDWCREQYGDESGEWFFEAKNLRRINDRLHEAGYQIETVHPFYIPGSAPGGGCEDVNAAAGKACRQMAEAVDKARRQAAANNIEIRWYEEADIEQFRGDARYKNAYSFCAEAPDVIGVGAIRDGKILGMAGASCDSPTMWQIGIDVDKSCRREGIGKMLVTLLSYEIQKRGKLPYYGTAYSHIGSQKVALGSGFIPAWAELVTTKITEQLKP